MKIDIDIWAHFAYFRDIMSVLKCSLEEVRIFVLLAVSWKLTMIYGSPSLRIVPLYYDCPQMFRVNKELFLLFLFIWPDPMLWVKARYKAWLLWGKYFKTWYVYFCRWHFGALPVADIVTWLVFTTRHFLALYQLCERVPRYQQSFIDSTANERLKWNISCICQLLSASLHRCFAIFFI